MIRHGMVEPSAAGAQPPATYPRESMVTTVAERRASGPAPSRQHRAQAQQCGMPVSIAASPGGGRAIADTGRRSKSP
ncbi:hypothetical protein FJ434_28550 [Mesorhizobium sp. B2-5-13]|nr:hypothetical protein FJ434_28550 [Mesorhizobium sp. B2-5-13]